MVSLNTLRTKFGIVLSVVIGLALLAFILSLKTEMGFTGNDPKVGEIDGESISYTEYLDAYDAVKNLLGGEAATDAELDRLSSAAWQQLFAQIVMTPGFEKMGLAVTDSERKQMINGTLPTQTLYNFFLDPSTGTYNVEAVAQFLAQAEQDPRAAAMWLQIVDQAVMERESSKYAAILRNGVYVNSAEVNLGLDAANKNFAGKVVMKPYSAVADSLITISDAEIRAYYKANKNRYRQNPNRTISYVVFEVEATDADMQAIENEVHEAETAFRATNDLRHYARENRRAELSDRYLPLQNYTAEEIEALGAGKLYGPVLKNNVWTMSRVESTLMAPDSIGVRHLALPYTEQQMADSLATLLRSGVAFAQVAQGSGEERVYPFAAFTEEFIPAITAAKVGDVVEIPAGNAIHIMQIYRKDKPSKHVRTVTVNYPVEASAATTRTVHGQAGIFAVDGAGSIEKFNEAASAAAVTPRVISIAQGERQVRGLQGSHDIVRWAAGAKRGDISEIFKVGNDYVVAMLTEIDNENYETLQEASNKIRTILMRDKKYEYLLNSLQATTLEEAAATLGVQIEEFTDVNNNGYFVLNRFEPRLVGAITAAQEGELSAPVKGSQVMALFVVDQITTTETQTADAERVRAQAAAESAAMQASFSAIEQMAEMEDLRAKYF